VLDINLGRVGKSHSSTSDHALLVTDACFRARKNHQRSAGLSYTVPRQDVRVRYHPRTTTTSRAIKEVASLFHFSFHSLGDGRLRQVFVMPSNSGPLKESILVLFPFSGRITLEQSFDSMPYEGGRLFMAFFFFFVVLILNQAPKRQSDLTGRTR